MARRRRCDGLPAGARSRRRARARARRSSTSKGLHARASAKFVQMRRALRRRRHRDPLRRDRRRPLDHGPPDARRRPGHDHHGDRHAAREAQAALDALDGAGRRPLRRGRVARLGRSGAPLFRILIGLLRRSYKDIFISIASVSGGCYTARNPPIGTAHMFNDYVVKDISLADWGRKEIAIAETEMPGLMAIARGIRREAAAQGRAHRRLAAHDDPDRRADRDAEGARRRHPLGLLQHLLDPGPCRRRDRRRRHAGLRRQGRDAGGILGLHAAASSNGATAARPT